MNILNNLRPINPDQLSSFFPVTRSIIKEAWKANIKVFQLIPERSFLILQKGKIIKWFYPGRTSNDNRVIAALARNKYFTKEFLSMINVPVPDGRVVTSIDELISAAKILGFPLVTKPLTGQEGKAVIVNIKTKNLLIKSYRVAKKQDENVMVEKYYSGFYYRVLVVDHKFFAASQAKGAEITGNGKNNISELIKIENRNPERTKNGRLQKIRLNAKARRLLLGQSLNPKSILPRGRKAVLSFSGADGGEWIDVTDQVHPDNKKMFTKVAKNLDLTLGGIDFLSPDVGKSYQKNKAVINEINSAPDISIHQQPTLGKPRNAARAIIKMLFN